MFTRLKNSLFYEMQYECLENFIVFENAENVALITYAQLPEVSEYLVNLEGCLALMNFYFSLYLKLCVER